MEQDEEKPVAERDGMTKKPCRECPYRRASAPGWLGSSTPEQFMLATFGQDFPPIPESPMPCHLSIDYEDPDWQDKWANRETGALCAGAAIMFANRVKLPKYIELPRRERSDEVFTHPEEFIAHHRSTGAHSWEEDE